MPCHLPPPSVYMSVCVCLKWQLTCFFIAGLSRQPQGVPQPDWACIAFVGIAMGDAGMGRGGDEKGGEV